MDTLSYYGIVKDGRHYAEVEVIREDRGPGHANGRAGRIISQHPTGIMYASYAEAAADNERKNFELFGAVAS